MPVVMPQKLVELSQANDPKQALWKALAGAVDEFQVMGAQILVGTYIEPEKTTGGIIKPQGVLQESLYMGTLGLVLKKGPWAFKDNPKLDIHWDGQNVEINDWIVFRYSSAWELHLNGVSVRLVDDRDVRAIISRPELMTSKPNLPSVA